MGKRSIKRRFKAQRKRQIAVARKLFKFHLAMTIMAWLLDSTPAFILHGVVTIYRTAYLRTILEMAN